MLQVEESEVFAFVRATSADGSGSITESVSSADILSYLESGGYKVPSESDITMPEITAVGLYPINVGGVRAILHVIEAVAIKHD
jgi:ribosomal protein L9